MERYIILQPITLEGNFMRQESWHEFLGEYIETPQKVIDFIDEIDEICKKYNVSISHEDGHGAFMIDTYDERNIKWLKNASLNI